MLVRYTLVLWEVLYHWSELSWWHLLDLRTKQRDDANIGGCSRSRLNGTAVRARTGTAALFFLVSCCEYGFPVAGLGWRAGEVELDGYKAHRPSRHGRMHLGI